MSDLGSNGLRTANSRLDGAVRSVIDRVHLQRGAGRMVILLVVTFLLFAALNPRVFLNPVNLQNIMVGAPEIGLISLAMMIAMLTGGIDLSVVAIANMAAITVSSLYTLVAATSGPETAEAMSGLIILAGIAMGALLGAVNGVLVSVVGVTPILTTLGTMQLFNGLALVWTGGVTISGAPTVLTTIGKTTLIGIPVLFLVLIVAAIVLALVIDRTPIGRKVQLQGANPAAARYSGISARSTLMLTYTVSGLLGALAGLVFLARNPSASADYGSSYVLLAIVIAVLGGTNPNGGFATVLGVVLATLTLQVVSSGFTAMRLSAYEYAIAQGVLLIAVMVFDQINFRRRRRSPLPAPPASSETVAIATERRRKDTGE
ncbi:ABC transporter permease [Microbacterium sp.]|uniref:ABC transporter permease n=1 Tax=Microbacterium sp. TaxID=51671 RepID=UPI002CFF9814|nr:ABC transporter permease [Microbacterium sp.]HWL76829.1 ABC transporter permease [Microbacterium sp.]